MSVFAAQQLAPTVALIGVLALKAWDVSAQQPPSVPQETPAFPAPSSQSMPSALAANVLLSCEAQKSSIVEGSALGIALGTLLGTALGIDDIVGV